MRLWLVLLSLVFSTGCYTVRYRTDLAPSGTRHERSLNYFAVGLIGQHDIDLDLYCPAGASAWRTEARPLDTVLSFVTLGIWTPRTAIIECGVAR